MASVSIMNRMGLFVGIPVLLLGFCKDKEKDSTEKENAGCDIECKRPFSMSVVWCHHRHQIWRNKAGSAIR